MMIGADGPGRWNVDGSCRQIMNVEGPASMDLWMMDCVDGPASMDCGCGRTRLDGPLSSADLSHMSRLPMNI